LDASASPRNSCNHINRLAIWAVSFWPVIEVCLSNGESEIIGLSLSSEFYVTVLGYLTILIAWSLLSLAALVASFVFTNPLEIGPAGVTVWFVILFSCVASCLTLCLYTAKTFLHLHATGASRLRYSWRQSLLLAGWATGLLALSSLHQLSILDGILLALLLLIVETYVRLRWP
jgi:hypothetical protein